MLAEQDVRALLDQARPAKPTLVQQLTALAAERQRRDFITFAQRAWHVIEPKRCRWNWHMDAIAEHLLYVSQREIRNLMIMIPPRMSKSLLCTVLWPAWHWLSSPGSQFICASYSSTLALEHSQLSRRVIESGWYQNFYGDNWYLLGDENRKDMYRNSLGGYRLTTSVGGRSTGEGGDIQLMDDPHDAKKVESDTTRQSTIEWHDNAWRSRLNDPNRAQKVYVAQRTHDGDVMGHVLSQEAHRWVQLCLAMEFDKKRICITYKNKGRGDDTKQQIFKDPRKVDSELLNPKRFNKETARTEQDAMSARAWNAQYQQQPEGAGGLILKRHWWRQWVYPDGHPSAKKERPLPEFLEIVDVYDTAFEEDEEADFSAKTTWGLFHHTDSFFDEKTGRTVTGKTRVNAIMLDMMEERYAFPELRDYAIESDKAWAPDRILIEKKSSGHSLIQELRKQGLPVKGIKIPSDMDLVARAHAASLMLEKGCIWYVPRRWAMKVIDQAAKFPAADHDDIVSTLAMAWMYMRRYHDLQLPDDKDDDQKDMSPWKWKQRRYDGKG